MKKIVIFDMDGVLVDTIEDAYKNVLLSHPFMTREEYGQLHAENYHEAIAKYRATNPPLEVSPEEHSIRTAAYTLQKSQASLFPGMRELLEKLQNEGYIVILNTSAYERNSFPLLERTDIKKFFDMLGTAEISKNKIDKFKIILEKYQVLAKDVLFVTDAIGDIREAREVNIPTVAVTWGVHTEEDFNKESYENLASVVDTESELDNFIENRWNK